MSRWLIQQGIDAPAYHSRMPDDEKVALEERLRQNRCKALVATVALGMGYDKPDLGFVVHYQRPGSVVAYYQQVGRAGRGIEKAIGVLLSGAEDDEIQEYFIDAAFPTAEETAEVLHLLEGSGSSGLTQVQMLQRLNLRPGTLDKILKLLQIEGAVGKDDTKYFRTPNPFHPNQPAQEEVTRRRRAELELTRQYVTHPGCLMEFLEGALDDPYAAPCGHCAGCAGDVVPREVDGRLVRKAIQYLKRENQLIEPRKKWPGGSTGPRRGAIPVELRLEQGRTLCRWGDPGWGSLVREGKYDATRFSDELVEAVADMIENRWKPSPPPAWVTAVPSLRHPALVPDFARRLAERLGLPFHQVIAKAKDTPPQKSMQNLAQQARNALDAFTISGSCPAGPVLLVDDVLDSGWTFTTCGVLLREQGSGPVYPVALAKASAGGDVT